ncbi:MAG: hypothetical protein UW28_C0022G0006 [Parcubacteria group bacterium GW2011_GWA2_44_13]|nr:MAG: hypothetical protein UW28_C0022G0006 [Parcubacteria group bacterium GW2011_GWA2_44_13]OGF96551.1 MAG: hypothetical protein A3H08_03415 [Candidatus Giovannonibacteria bacterium RIFCSPLOWO2_12_FULL_44_32]
MRFQKLKNFFRELIKPPNFLIFLANLVFTYVWGPWGWVNAELWGSDWWFDTLGHAIFGFGWAFALLYWAKKYLNWIYIQLHKFLLAIVIIAMVTWIETQFWEGIEFLWDKWAQPNFFLHLATAQKGNLDTTLDILFTSYAAAIAMIFWGAYRKFFAWKWPNEALKEAHEEIIERSKLSAEEIQSIQTEHKKLVVAKIRSFWEKHFS